MVNVFENYQMERKYLAEYYSVNNYCDIKIVPVMFT